MWYVYTHKQSGQKYVFTQTRHGHYVATLGRKLPKTYVVESYPTSQAANNAAGVAP